MYWSDMVVSTDTAPTIDVDENKITVHTVGSYQMAHLFNCWLVHICCKNQQNYQNEPSDNGAI